MESMDNRDNSKCFHGYFRQSMPLLLLLLLMNVIQHLHIYVFLINFVYIIDFGISTFFLPQIKCSLISINLKAYLNIIYMWKLEDRKNAWGRIQKETMKESQGRLIWRKKRWNVRWIYLFLRLGIFTLNLIIFPMI